MKLLLGGVFVQRRPFKRIYPYSDSVRTGKEKPRGLKFGAYSEHPIASYEWFFEGFSFPDLSFIMASPVPDPTQASQNQNGGPANSKAMILLYGRLYLELTQAKICLISASISASMLSTKLKTAATK